MTRSFRALLCAGTAAAGLLGLAANPARAQNTAADAYNAYNAAFLVQQNGQTYYSSMLTKLGTAPQSEWGEALDIDVAEDRYQYTHAQADRNFVIAQLNSLAYFNGPGSLYGNWQTDGWDDNLAWMVNSFIRGYQMTGIANYLTQAAAGWNNGYNQGWDTTVAGGGIWENTNKQSKCGLSNSPFVFEGVQLYMATGDVTYLNKSEAIYAWMRSTLFNATNATNARGAPGQVDGCVGSNGALQGLSSNVYDSGSFIKAATELYRVTANATYYNDAALAIGYVMNKASIVPYQGGEAGHQWAYWFTRGMSDFATEANLWSTYGPYLTANANAAWSKRNASNLTWNDWTNVTNDANPDGNEMSSAAAIWQQLPPPSVSLTGTYELVNAASSLALNVYGGQTTNGALVIQYPYANGQTNALWTFTPTSGGYYQIKNVNSGLVLNVTGASGLSGAKIVQWPAMGMIPGNDQWLPVQNPDGSYSFFNLASQQALDIPGGTATVGQQADQWFGNSTKAQSWTLVAH